jgi:hypothetical protein
LAGALSDGRYLVTERMKVCSTRLELEPYLAPSVLALSTIPLCFPTWRNVR